MSLRLNGSAGTGKKIIKNWNLFSFVFGNRNGDSYTFDVNFDGQIGMMTIVVENGNVINGTLDCNFKKTLGIYNDPTLQQVAERMMLNISE